jgi:hypothetical protein
MQTNLFIFIFAICYSYFIDSLLTYLLYKNERDFFQNTTQSTFDMPPLPPGIEPEEINNVSNYNYNELPYPLLPDPTSPKEKIKFYIKLAIGIISIISLGQIKNVIISNGIALGGVFIILSNYFFGYMRFSPLEKIFVSGLSLCIFIYKIMYNTI